MTPARACLRCGRLTRDGSYCGPCKPRNGSTGAWRQVRAQVLVRDRHTCQLQLPGCNRVANTVDHLRPVTHGGTDAPTNLVAACSHCNYRKGSKR